MTKSQSNTAFSTGANQNEQYNQNSQSSYNAAQEDVGNYENQLSQYASQNPFTAGGAYQTAQNQQLADTAAGGAQAAQQAAQSAAVRSGENPAAAIAAGEQVAQSNAQNQMGDVAAANQSRIGQGAQYGQNVLNATAVPEQMEASLTGQQAGAANSALNEEEGASKTPSFWQELGQGTIGAGTSFAGAYGKSLCWIAARLFGGWLDPRTVVVRLWLAYSFGRRWYGKPVVWLYGLIGQRIAERLMPRSPLLTKVMNSVFRSALRKAILWSAEGEGRFLLEEHRVLLRMVRRIAPIVNEKATADLLLMHCGSAVLGMRMPDNFNVTVTAPKGVR